MSSYAIIESLMGSQFMRQNTELNHIIATDKIENDKVKMLEEFSNGIRKFCNIAPRITESHNRIGMQISCNLAPRFVESHNCISDDMKNNVDRMYQDFNQAIETATMCINDLSHGQVLCKAMNKKITEKESEVKNEMEKCKRQRADCIMNKEYAELKVDAAREKVVSARENVWVAEEKAYKGYKKVAFAPVAGMASGSVIGAPFGGPLGSCIGAVVGFVFGFVGGRIKTQPLRNNHARAKRDLRDSERHLEDQRRKVAQYEQEIIEQILKLETGDKNLYCIKQLNKQIGDHAQTLKGQIGYVNKIRNCLPVFITISGRSYMHDILKSNILTSGCPQEVIVTIVQDMARYLRNVQLAEVLSSKDHFALHQAIKLSFRSKWCAMRWKCNLRQDFRIQYKSGDHLQIDLQKHLRAITEITSQIILDVMPEIISLMISDVWSQVISVFISEVSLLTSRR